MQKTKQKQTEKPKKKQTKKNLPKDWHLETSLSREQMCFKGTIVVCVCACECVIWYYKGVLCI